MTTLGRTLATLLVTVGSVGCSGTWSASAPSSVPTASGSASAPDGDGDAPATNSEAPPASGAPAPAGPLPGTADIGVPDSWTIVDLDPSIMDEFLAEDADPFQGFLQCPGLLPPSGEWIQRRFTTTDPLDNGMLRVDIIVITEEQDAFDIASDALSECATSTPNAYFESEPVDVVRLGGVPAAPVGEPVPGVALTLHASPTEHVAFPSAYSGIVAHRDGHTVLVVVSGVDLGVPFADPARDVAGRMLERL